MSDCHVNYYAACIPDGRRHCFTDDVWDPFYPFPTIHSEAMADAPFQWKETEKAHVMTTRLPGVRKEEMRVEVERGGFLKIEVKEETVQRSSSHEFLKRFRLPENAKVDELVASMKEDGVLTVTVPKYCHQIKVVQIV